MNVDALVGTVSGAAASAVVVAEAMRRYWGRREARQQAAFRAAVQAIVDQSIADVIRRQTDFEKRQGRHLDKQDAAIGQLRDLIRQRKGPGSDRLP